MDKPDRRNKARGATMVEYAIALSILLLSLYAVMKYLEEAAKSRAGASQNTVSTMVPCEGVLGEDDDGDPSTVPEKCL